MNAPTLLVIATLSLYAAATVLIWRAHRAGQQTGGAAMVLGGCAVIAHLLLTDALLRSDAGLNLGLVPVVVLLLLIATLFVLAASLFAPVRNLLLFAFPASAAAVALTLGSSEPTPVGELSTPLVIHILFAIVAYGILIMAAAQSLLLSYQERHLKQHVSGGLLQVLPPLETMERLLFAMLWLGIGILTLAIVTGFAYLDDLFAQRVVHHTVLACLSWLVYAVLLTGRRLFGWRGTTAVRFTLLAFGLLVLGYLGSKFVIEVLLAQS
ncbi:MAG: cytochrome C assembly family protein [Pseudomonadales bacterium]